jgi:hypothetical protein
MAALDALTSKLLPERDEDDFIKEVMVDRSSTTTNPYTSGGKSVNLQTGTNNSDILQAIQQLDEKVTGGFAQVMAKLSNTPIKGGGAGINSQRSIEMSAANSGMASAPSKSMWNSAKNLLGLGSPAANAPLAPPATNSAAPATNSAAPAANAPPAANAAPAANAPPAANAESTTSSLSGGRRRRSRTRKSRRSRLRRRGSRRH